MSPTSSSFNVKLLGKTMNLTKANAMPKLTKDMVKVNMSLVTAVSTKGTGKPTKPTVKVD